MGHQAHHQDVEDAARNCSRYGHHVQPRHHMVDTASVFANRVPRKDAHRWGSLPNTSGSRLPTWVRDDLVTRRRLAIKAECRKGPLCLWSQLDIALNRHHCLGEVGHPALWRSPCTLPRVQRGVKRINSVRQRSNFCLLLASNPRFPAWRQTHVAPLPAPEGVNRFRVAVHGAAPPNRCSTTRALSSRGSPGSEGYCAWTSKTGERLPSKSLTHIKTRTKTRIITCPRMMDPNPKQLTSAILFSTTAKWVALWGKELPQFTTAHFPSRKTNAGCLTGGVVAMCAGSYQLCLDPERWFSRCWHASSWVGGGCIRWGSDTVLHLFSQVGELVNPIALLGTHNPANALGVDVRGWYSGGEIGSRPIQCENGFFMQVRFLSTPFLLSEFYRSASMHVACLHPVVHCRGSYLDLESRLWESGCPWSSCSHSRVISTISWSGRLFPTWSRYTGRSALLSRLSIMLRGAMFWR